MASTAILFIWLVLIVCRQAHDLTIAEIWDITHKQRPLNIGNIMSMGLAGSSKKITFSQQPFACLPFKGLQARHRLNEQE